MNDLRQLYQEVILDHNRSPRNFHCIEGDCCKANGFNPLCGDQITVYLQIANNIIIDASFQGNGCAISIASASLMTEALKGKTKAEAQQLFTTFHNTMTQKTAIENANLGKLAVLEGVKDYPARIKCATLAWHAGLAAINHEQADVTTE